MPITFRNQSNNVTTGTSPTGTEPAGTVAKDFLLAFYAAGLGTGTNLPTGWTSLYSGANGSTFSYNVGYIIRGALAPSLAFTHTGSVYYELHILCFSGVNTANPIDSQSASGSTYTSTALPDSPATTAVASPTLAICGGIQWAGSNATPWTAPTGYTVRTRNTLGDDLTMGSKALVTKGSEDPSIWTGFTVASNAGWNGFTISLRPHGEYGMNNYQTFSGGDGSSAGGLG